MGKRSKFQYRARGKRRKPFRFLGPEQRLREQVEKIAWCRRRVAVESARLNKMLAENPELRAEQDVPSRPTLVVDNTRSRPPRRRLGGSGPHAA
jgi:hypothetical protein